MNASRLLPSSAVMAVIGMVVLGAAAFFGVQFTVNRALSIDAEYKARGWAEYLIANMPQLDRLIETGNPNAAQLAIIESAQKVGDIFLFKLFDRNGDMTVVSDEPVFGTESSPREHSDKAAGVLATGEANVSLNSGAGKQNRPPLYVEAYVPILDRKGQVTGVVEVYVNQTGAATLFKSTFAALAVGIALFVAFVFGLPATAYLLRSKQAREARRRVDYLARYDPLTGVLNRASFTEQLQGALLRRRDGERLAVVFLDVDEFKVINDNYGHEAGDDFLKHVASCIERQCGTQDMVSRQGGDEFTLALFGRSQKQLSELIESIMDAVRQPIPIRNGTVAGRLSCGIYVVEDGVTALADALHKADVALYQAKVDRGDAWRFFSQQMETAMRAQRELEQRVRDAVEHDRFELHYQPLLFASTGQCSGFEALLRLPDGAGGYVSPARFIPVLETLGLINAVGKWVVEEATRTASTWPPNLSVSVNLSVRQFEQNDLVGQVKSALGVSGLPAERLELEVTESILMENTDSIVRQLEELRSIGVSMAMDDFGTGYSSLAYLWQFRFDKLKIDRSFVAALEERDRQAKDILDTIIMLGHRLEMSVTAEGIETPNQAAVLSALSCDQFQGYLYGKPVPALSIPAYLLRNLDVGPASDVQEVRNTGSNKWL